jgi:hypothetical protein
MAPLALLMLIGIVVAAVVGMNYVQLHNAVRDGARAAAVCGGAASRNNETKVPLLPNGHSCSDAELISFVKARFQAIPGNQASLQVTLPTGGSGDHMSQCQYSKTVEVQASYDQPIFLPLLGRLLSNNGSGRTFTINAKAEATCEQ